MSNRKKSPSAPCPFCTDGKLYTLQNMRMHQANKHWDQLSQPAALSDATAKLQAAEAEIATLKAAAPTAKLCDWDKSEWLQKMPEDAWRKMGELNHWTLAAPVADAEEEPAEAEPAADEQEPVIDHVLSCPNCKTALYDKLKAQGWKEPEAKKTEPTQGPAATSSKPVIKARMPNGQPVIVTGVKVS